MHLIFGAIVGVIFIGWLVVDVVRGLIRLVRPEPPIIAEPEPVEPAYVTCNHCGARANRRSKDGPWVWCDDCSGPDDPEVSAVELLVAAGKASPSVMELYRRRELRHRGR